MSQLNQIEQEFVELIQWIKTNFPTNQNIQELIKPEGILQEKDIPEKYQRSLKFYRSLSGISREFLFRIVCGKSKNKTHLREKVRFSRKKF